MGCPLRWSLWSRTGRLGRPPEPTQPFAPPAAGTVDEHDLRKALGQFDPVWDALLPRERIRILRVLLEKVDYREGKLGVTFRATGIRALAEEATEAQEATP